MRKVLINIILFSFIISAVIVPHTSFALEIIPCDGVDTVDPDGQGGTFGEECGLDDVIILIKNIINAIILLAIPFMTLALMWVGFLILTAQGNVNKIQEAKRITKNVFIGFVFILTAWLIVYTIVTYFLDPKYRLFF